MIVSASRRTDIPAFYAEWFMRRIREGSCLVSNPFNPTQVARVSLAPPDVDAIVFWSKNPRPFFKHLPELDERGYRYYFQFTLNGYDRDLEPHVPDLERRLETFTELSERIGPDRLIWRYDPIILSDKTTAEFHERTFEHIAGALTGRTKRVFTSFVTYYRKTDRNLRLLEDAGWRFDHAVSVTAQRLLYERMGRIARGRGMELFSCADATDFSGVGVRRGSCVDGKLIRDLWGGAASMTRDPGQREACLCSVSKDIGAVDTCPHGCLYCYSTQNAALALRRHSEHDPASPILHSDLETL